MIPYILHVAILITVCLLFYKLLLQKETFYRLNRWVLVFCLALSFVIPLVPVPPQWALLSSSKGTEETIQPAAYTPTATLPQNKGVQTPPDVKIAPTKLAEQKIAPTPTSSLKESEPATFQLLPLLRHSVKWLFYLYWIGVAAFGLNLLLQLVVLLFQAYTKPAIIDGKFRIIELSGDKAPCSFGNNIFINPEKYDWETYSQILLHEKIHIEQRHSFDILMAELVLVLQWFNPFAWLYRTELESNLEFLTDNSVLEHKEIERSSYQMSLLKVSAPHLSLGITTNYNQSLLKKRILMMNAKRSNIHIMWKYFFLLPLLGILACALNDPAAYSRPVAKAKTNMNNYGNYGHWINHTATEGTWFANIKLDKIRIEFRSDSDDRNWSSNSDFKVSEFSPLPRTQKGDFTLTREAGTILFNGKFDGDQGYGHYKFTADKQFKVFLSQHGITDLEEGDDFAFFIVNIKKDYLVMLENNGYKGLSK
ncbi:MAG TPA: M56 family metallopeptidase, partial [Mucilaginibacter sp.]